jgi:hypothetical protein
MESLLIVNLIVIQLFVAADIVLLKRALDISLNIRPVKLILVGLIVGQSLSFGLQGFGVVVAQHHYVADGGWLKMTPSVVANIASHIEQLLDSDRGRWDTEDVFGHLRQPGPGTLFRLPVRKDIGWRTLCY